MAEVSRGSVAGEQFCAELLAPLTDGWRRLHVQPPARAARGAFPPYAITADEAAQALRELARFYVEVLARDGSRPRAYAAGGVCDTMTLLDERLWQATDTLLRDDLIMLLRGSVSCGVCLLAGGHAAEDGKPVPRHDGWDSAFRADHAGLPAPSVAEAALAFLLRLSGCPRFCGRCTVRARQAAWLTAANPLVAVWYHGSTTALRQLLQPCWTPVLFAWGGALSERLQAYVRSECNRSPGDVRRHLAPVAEQLALLRAALDDHALNRAGAAELAYPLARAALVHAEHELPALPRGSMAQLQAAQQVMRALAAEGEALAARITQAQDRRLLERDAFDRYLLRQVRETDGAYVPETLLAAARTLRDACPE